jgi:hypothetical protein
MIITQEDLDLFEREFESAGLLLDLNHWLTNNPHVLMTTGFTEYIAPGTTTHKILLGEYSFTVNPLFRKLTGGWVKPWASREIPTRKDEPWDGLCVDTWNATYRSFDIEGTLVPGDAAWSYVRSECYRAAYERLPSFDTIYNMAAKYVDNPLVDPTVFLSPTIWTPSSKLGKHVFLRDSALKLIRAIQGATVELESLHWKEFECVVAEVLRASGMEIHLADESPQGGRDIIARTQPIGGGEILTLAIEVKHRNVVDRPMVQLALRQNSQFPALMFVTSGRFTSGVFREAQAPQNRMRLFLKDGVAIRDLIRLHPLL